MRYALIALALIIAWPAAAKEVLPGPIPASVISVTDGDTFKADVVIWLGTVKTTNVRILGIDTAETGYRAKCPEEKAAGLIAKAYLVRLLGTGPVTLSNVKADKYGGRVLADVDVGGVDVGQRMIAKGLAREYGGGKRGSWCGE